MHREADPEQEQCGKSGVTCGPKQWDRIDAIYLNAGDDEAIVWECDENLAAAFGAVSKFSPRPGLGAMHQPDLYQVHGAAVLIPAEASWIEATEENRKVIPGVNQAGI